MLPSPPPHTPPTQQKVEAEIIKKKTQVRANLMAKRGESDRSIQTPMPKHLFAGKRGNGSASHR